MKNLIVLAVAVLALGAAAPAYAQSSNNAPYLDNAPLSQEEVGGNGPANSGSGTSPAGADQGTVAGSGTSPAGADQGTVAHTTSNGSSGRNLPFTGMDLLLLLAGGVVFLGFGLTLRRFTRSPDLA